MSLPTLSIASPSGLEVAFGTGLAPEVALLAPGLAVRDRAMLVAGGASDLASGRTPISNLRVLRMVGRRSLPSLIEATLIPSLLFYVFLVAIGPVEAMCAALAWSYGSVLRRLVGRQRIPGVLQLAVAGLTVRTIVGLLSGTFMYFLQPVASTVVLSLVFLGSLRFGRPMIARMASDFCPLAGKPSGTTVSDLATESLSPPALPSSFTFLVVLKNADPLYVGFERVSWTTLRRHRPPRAAGMLNRSSSLAMARDESWRSVSSLYIVRTVSASPSSITYWSLCTRYP